MRDFVIKHIEKFDTLSIEHRINILFDLLNGGKFWNDLMFDNRINPKSLRDHLKILMDRGYVEKDRFGGYVLTDNGVALCNLEWLGSSRRKTEVE